MIAETAAGQPPTIHSIRPLKDLAEQLEASYATPVTFEEPFLMWPGGREEDPRLLGRFMPRYRDFVPTVGLGSATSFGLDLAILKTALAAYHSQTDRSRYGVAESKMGFHIVPIEAAGAGGIANPAGSLPDQVITVPFTKHKTTGNRAGRGSKPSSWLHLGPFNVVFYQCPIAAKMARRHRLEKAILTESALSGFIPANVQREGSRPPTESGILLFSFETDFTGG